MVKRRQLLSNQLIDKQFVSLSYWPERTGRIVELGNEVSEVKFLDGQRAAITNKWLIPVEEP
jgi:hypothetical protein